VKKQEEGGVASKGKKVTVTGRKRRLNHRSMKEKKKKEVLLSLLPGIVFLRQKKGIVCRGKVGNFSPGQMAEAWIQGD